MKVKELIEYLQKCDQEREIWIDTRSKESDLVPCTETVECTIIKNEKWSEKWVETDVVLFHAREE